MIQALPLPFKWATLKLIALVLYLMYASVMLLSLHSYLAWQSLNVILGVIALPLVTIIQPAKCNNIRYGIVTALLAMVTVLLPVKTMLYFTVAFACFFITENFLGKLNLLPVGVVFFDVPGFFSLLRMYSVSL